MQDPDFANDVRAEKNKLAGAIAIRSEREAYGWSQQELASKAGVPQSTVVRVESGANKSMETLLKIANAFGKSIQIMFS